MSTNQAHNQYENPASAAANGESQHQDFEKVTQGMSHEEKQRAVQASRFGYGPLAHIKTNDSGGLLPGTPAFKPSIRANLRLHIHSIWWWISTWSLQRCWEQKVRQSGASRSFSFCAHDLRPQHDQRWCTRHYGAQHCGRIGFWLWRTCSASRWHVVCYALRKSIMQLTNKREMAVGNTFGATALSSYGGFWLAFAIVLTPGGFEIVSSLETANGGLTQFHNSFSLFLWVSLRRRSLLVAQLTVYRDGSSSRRS